MVLLMRMSPVFPYTLLNYSLGLTNVRFSDYALASIGMLPGTLLYAYYGVLAGDVARLAGGTAVERGPGYYAVLVLGSAGRGESLLSADQDNAIVYESGEASSPEDRWFETLGTHIADILDRVGVPYCQGGVMAKNRAWRQSAADWQQTVDHWITRQHTPRTC